LQVFDFGTIIARLPEPGASTGAASTAAAGGAAAVPGAPRADAKGGPKQAAGARGSVKGKAAGGGGAAAAGEVAVSAELVSALSLKQRGTIGSTAAAAEEPAVKANLKFTNPVKVPCTVNFTVKPRGSYLPGQVFPMEVHPASITIPPNESRCGAGRLAGCV
jgi:hypothetical protein